MAFLWTSSTKGLIKIRWRFYRICRAVCKIQVHHKLGFDTVLNNKTFVMFYSSRTQNLLLTYFCNGEWPQFTFWSVKALFLRYPIEDIKSCRHLSRRFFDGSFNFWPCILDMILYKKVNKTTSNNTANLI